MRVLLVAVIALLVASVPAAADDASLRRAWTDYGAALERLEDRFGREEPDGKGPGGLGPFRRVLDQIVGRALDTRDRLRYDVASSDTGARARAPRERLARRSRHSLRWYETRPTAWGNPRSTGGEPRPDVVEISHERRRQRMPISELSPTMKR